MTCTNTDLGVRELAGSAQCPYCRVTCRLRKEGRLVSSATVTLQASLKLQATFDHRVPRADSRGSGPRSERCETNGPEFGFAVAAVSLNTPRNFRAESLLIGSDPVVAHSHTKQSSPNDLFHDFRAPVIGK